MPPGYRDTRTVAVGLFQAAEAKLFQQVIRPGMTVADVGAYVGYFTVLSAKLVGASGQVFAFEPDAIAFHYLTRNVAENECLNVVATRKGLTDPAPTPILSPAPQRPTSFQ